jgi:hypothetical protein
MIARRTPLDLATAGHDVGQRPRAPLGGCAILIVHRACTWASVVLFALVLAAGATPAAAQVPTPESVFGFAPGSDYKLADYPTVTRYFEALDAASERVWLEQIGESTLGQPMLLAAISSEENLRELERHKQTNRALAHARIAEDEAMAMARDGKVVVWIDGGLHATEVAHGQMTPELAHWLATDEGEEARRIRENAIVLIMPNMNPDGLNIVQRWYMQNVGTEFETAPVPELYHHYIGHDNNRDWYMFTQSETQAVARQLYHEWFPQIVYNHHQSGPFPGRIWVPPFENPVNPNLDPLIVTSLNEIGEAMKKRFAREGKPGVSSGIVYDLWWNGSMRGAPDFHNMLGFLTETALYRYATPHCYGEDEIPETFGARAGFMPADRPTTQYPDPWEGGCWHVRDAMDYMITASKAVMDHASKHRQDYLENIYLLGQRQIARGEAAEGGPFAYVMDPAEQHDPGALDELLRTFLMGGIEIRRAESPLQVGRHTFPAGSYVIGPQAFRPFVVDLMEPKTFPDRRLYPGGPPEPPYDMTGYELGLQMGINAVGVMEAFELPPVVEEIPASAASVDDAGGDAVWMLSPRQNNAASAVNRLLEQGARISRVTAVRMDVGGEPSAPPPGTFIIENASRDVVDELAAALGVRLTGAADPPAGRLRTLRAPRIGIYRGHVSNMPEGWTRWVLDEYGFSHERVDNDRIRSGDLDDLDVLIFPDQGADEILNGHDPGTMPPEYLGGVGAEGVEALRAWVADGGWVLAMDNAIDFAIEGFGLPLENLVRDLPTEEFFIPGTLLHLDVDAADPLAWGMTDEAIAFFVRSQSMGLTRAPGSPLPDSMGEPVVYARYSRGDVLASGWVNGADEYVAGRAAAVRVPIGNGQVVLTAFEPHFRGQPHNTFKLLFGPLFAAASEGLVGGRPATFPE